MFYPEVYVCARVYINIHAQTDTQSCIHAYTHPYSYIHTHTLTHIIILQPKSQLIPGWLNLGIFLSQT